MSCAWYGDLGYADVSCASNLQITNTPDSMDDSMSGTWLVKLPFSNRWTIRIDVLIVTQDYFPTYIKPALESLETGFLNFDSADILNQTKCGVYPVHCKLFSNIPRA